MIGFKDNLAAVKAIKAEAALEEGLPTAIRTEAHGQSARSAFLVLKLR